jgi:hypothetical protein
MNRMTATRAPNAHATSFSFRAELIFFFYSPVVGVLACAEAWCSTTALWTLRKAEKRDPR